MLQGEHSAILLTFIKLPFVSKIFVLSIFEWPFNTGFTVIFIVLHLSQLIMPPTLKKLTGHIALGLSARPSVRPLQVLDRVLKFHRWTQHQKITDLYFF